MLDAPERPITITTPDGESFEFDPPDELWLDMLAFCEVTGLNVEQLIKRALAEYLLR